MNDKIINPNDKKYDLEERTAKFAEEVLRFLKAIPETTINRTIIIQLVKSVTSIAANYCEADGAESKKDFKHKIALCKKEAKETKLWLRMLSKTNPEKSEQCRKFWREAQELTLIFSAILKK
jgi:four helix bundle protein